MTTTDKTHHFTKSLAAELRPDRLIASIAAGLLTGSLIVLVAISFATLAFSGKLDSYIGIAVGLGLAGAAVGALLFALTSSYPGSIHAVQDSPSAVIALMVGAIVTAMDGSPDRVRFVTSLAAIMLASILTGSAMIFLGTARLGRLVRFIPYPVIGGFLAGTGYLLVFGGLNVMTGLSLTPDTINAHLTPEMALRWVPGVLLAVTLLLLTRRIKHPLLIPIVMIAAVLIYIVAMLVTQTSTEQATALGLVVGPLTDGGVWQMPPVTELLAADWGVIASQTPQFVTIIFLSVIPLLLNSTGVELVTAHDMDLNQELRATGLANVAAGLVGGMPGFQALSITLLGHWMHTNSRLIGLVAASVAAGALLLGGQFLALVPNAILGGFLLFMGLSLLVEWGYDAARRLPRSEYLIIVMILIVIATRGYLDGVAFGIIAAVILFLIQYSRQSVVKHSFSNATYRSTVLRSAAEEAILHDHGASILILQLQGYIFFGTANSVFELLKSRIADASLPKLRYVLLDFRRVTDLDTSAVLSFTRMSQLASQQGFVLILSGLLPQATKQLAALDNAGGTRAPVHRFAELDRALEWAENELLAHGKPLELGIVPIERMLAATMGSELAAVITGYMKRIEVPKGEYLVRQGDTAADLYFIESGVLSAQIELNGGQTMRVRTAKCGTVVGEIGFYLKTTRTASIVADQPSVVYALPPEVLKQMADEAPVAAAAMHEYLASILAERLYENTVTLRAALS